MSSSADGVQRVKRLYRAAQLSGVWLSSGRPSLAVRATASILLGLSLFLTAAGAHARPRGRAPAAGPAKIAVQPLEGTNGPALRALVSRIVRGRGFRAVTNVPRQDGTGQYPQLARDGHLTAFVTGDLEEKGKWASVTFLVWNGLTGSVLGRWTASAPVATLGNAVGKGFWRHLGPAMKKAEAPPLPLDQQQAPAMRIDATAEEASAEPMPRAERERPVAIID
jgi:hypothetical protein